MLKPLLDQTHSRPNHLYAILRTYGIALLFGFVELISFAPLVILAQVYALDSTLVITCIQVLLCYVIGAYFGHFTWLSRKGYEHLICIAVGFGLSYFFQLSLLHTALGAAIGALLVYRGIRYTKDGWSSQYTPGIFVISGVMYFIGVPIMTRVEMIQPYQLALNGLGFGTLILYFFITNRTQLLVATLAGNDRDAASSLSQTVKRSSRIWLIGFIAVIAAVGYFQQIKQGLTNLLLGMVAWLLGLMSSEAPPEVPVASPSAPPPMAFPPAPPDEPGWFDILMQVIAQVIGYIFVIALVLLCLYLLLKKLGPALFSFLRRFWKQSLRNEQGDTSDGYSDEKEALLDWKELPQLWWRKASSALWPNSQRDPSWSQLPNNQERVRYLYRVLIGQASKSGYSFKRALTPNETGWELTHQTPLAEASVQALTSVYNRVRYGREAISDEELAQVLQTLDPNIRNQLK
ncbi:DUF4129 domain-containing protein [Paenibacillus qinlingensis]|uniref:Protein-glutamine gamma-glutamyltransferase-like C-terminal domain-containing protein n=1 Tax=Paenibacillus qinlingensis TaxID=1837343 RepID=A0ABU1P785_9BACL|nr:DUF4129 domain-containing protein [Paenibacillus qinlingensis]MDR6555186.1 hypothetical protein [Paenibacillus qinlingensis]